VRAIKIVLWTVLILVIAPILILVLVPPSPPSHQRQGEYETLGVLLERVDYQGKPTTALEYEANVFRDWGGMARELLGISGDTSSAVALLTDSSFSNGTIEVDLASTVVAKYLGLARGFAGIAFRVSEDLESYELVYLRPANGRSNNQTQRSHTVQYAAHPDFHFDVSRRVAPGVFESSANIGLDEWIHLRIEVNEQQAEIYVDGVQVLMVDKLILGDERSGGIALWVGLGTNAYFSNLEITLRET